MYDFIAVIFATMVTVALTAYVLCKIKTYTQNSNPVHLTNQEGTISPGKVTAWFTIIIGVILMFSGLYFTFISDSSLTL